MRNIKTAVFILLLVCFTALALCACRSGLSGDRRDDESTRDSFTQMLDSGYTYEMDEGSVLATSAAAYTPLAGENFWLDFENRVNGGEKASVHIWYTTLKPEDDLTVSIITYDGEVFVKRDYSTDESGKWSVAVSTYEKLVSRNIGNGILIKSLESGGDICILLEKLLSDEEWARIDLGEAYFDIDGDGALEHICLSSTVTGMGYKALAAYNGDELKCSTLMLCAEAPSLAMREGALMLKIGDELFKLGYADGHFTFDHRSDNLEIVEPAAWFAE